MGRYVSRERAEIIAEIGANHGGSSESIRTIIDAAADAGATAVKVQVYTAESMTIDSGKSQFICRHWPWQGMRLFDIYKQGALPPKLLGTAAMHAQMRNLKFIVSVYSPADFQVLRTDKTAMERTWAVKIASFELNDLPLISLVSDWFPRIILSTGLADMPEIEEAIAAADACKDIAILHCVSRYPAPVARANLGRIEGLQRLADMAKRTIRVGYSDHTTSTTIPAVAVALGATIIEKHIRQADFFERPGLDQDFSLSSDQFAMMVRGIRETEAAMRPDHAPFYDGMGDLTRSLYVVADIAAGGVFTRSNVRSIRPGYGMEPKRLPDVLEKTATRALRKGDPLREGDVNGLDAAAGDAGIQASA